MRWHDLLAAVALLLVIEGILPFVGPAKVKQALDAMHRMSDTQLRIAGLLSMILGLLLLTLINQDYS